MSSHLHSLPVRFQRLIPSVLLSMFLCFPVLASQPWSTKLDGRVRFYLPTELGVIVAATEKSLYAVDGESGEVLWRQKNARLDETDVTPVPGTDLLLTNSEKDKKTRLEARDLLTGTPLWRSDKVRGAVMQMAFEPNQNLLAVVFVRGARGKVREGFKRKPVVYMFDVATGRELWKRELGSEIEMMPAFWKANEDVPYTLANYRPPAFLDDRIYLFYEGLTSLDVQSGKDWRREKFRINEEGLALTEADQVADERHIYISGRGRVRAIARRSGEEIWEAKDLGSTPEMVLTREVLYVRTGGQFTRVRDGDTVSRGPYGVSAIDVNNGRVLWRYKGADKGITNIALPDSRTVLVADRDDLIFVDATNGKRRFKVTHRVERAAFVLLNERAQAVVGGRNEIAAFDLSDGRSLWRARYDPPQRGLLRTVGAVAARAASLYFRYGGAVTTVFRGAQLLNTASSFRASGLTTHVVFPNLTSLATSSARVSAEDRFRTFGVLARTGRPSRDNVLTPRPAVEIEDRLFDRVDPARQLERLSRVLWRQRRLAALRGNWMYFYTRLPNGDGLIGVNINTGIPERAIRLSDPDERFATDEVVEMLYASKGDRLLGLGFTEP